MTAREQLSMIIELGVTFRLATEADLPRLEWFGQYSHYRLLFHRALQDQHQGRRLMILAICNDFPIGQIFIQFSSADLEIADGETRAYLYALRVMEMFRGQGIGTRLIQEAESRLLDRGFSWATIAVARANHDALRLYQRLGYTIFRDDPGHWTYRDQHGHRRAVHEPCWLLEKRLV